jgi:hypothetical protein
MRAARFETIARPCQTPLVVRASLPRAFWSLGLFVEASLCCCGVYLLMVVIRQPIEADQATILAAGVILGLATTLLVLPLAGPQRRAGEAGRALPSEIDGPPETPLTTCDEMMKVRKKVEFTLEGEDDLPGPM